MFSYRRRICNQRRLNGRISGFGGESGVLSVSYGAAERTGFARVYFSAFSRSAAVLEPPLASTNLVITGTNLAAISGDRPSLWKASATSTVRPILPGKELSRPENSEFPVTAGAALSRLCIPGTAEETLLNSSSLRRVLASANSEPAPPRACVGVMESPLVNCPTSAELEFVGTAVWALAGMPASRIRQHTQAAADVFNR